MISNMYYFEYVLFQIFVLSFLPHSIEAYCVSFSGFSLYDIHNIVAHLLTFSDEVIEECAEVIAVLARVHSCEVCLPAF